MPLWPGAPYESAAVAGGFVFAAGACPIDDEGRVDRAPTTALGISFLGYPDQLVEIEAIAVLSKSPAAKPS
jgi:enamine deaminase RidA (YjgF/YER057c/UK114 family)